MTSTFSQNQASAVQVGNDAGWVLEFYEVGDDGSIGNSPAQSFQSSDYYADIDASLNEGLQGGSYTITIYGLIDSDYQQISKAQHPKRIAAKLYLFWNDAISGPASYLTNMVGVSSGPSTQNLQNALVAVLFVHVKRKLGAVSYDTEIHGTEWAYHRMTQPLQSQLQKDDYGSVCAEIANRTKVAITTYPKSGRLTTDAAGTSGSEAITFAEGITSAAALQKIAKAVEKNHNIHGRSIILIRNGQIYLGPRPFPLEGDPKDLTYATGLLECFQDGSADQDPTAPDPSGENSRPHFTLILKGRPDIKPGDLVRFDPSTEDDSTTTPGIAAALAGALAGPILPGAGTGLSANPTKLAVSSVRHRLGKSSGFSTEVKGVVLEDLSQPWDTYSDTGAAPKPAVASPTADAAGSAASAITEHVQDWTSNLINVDVGQVRKFSSQTQGAQPSQSETVWEGLREVDQNPNGSRRLPIDNNNAVRMDIPYASPFAWGNCGLVLPRYPGTRVALGHRRALDHDPIDLGAIWDSGTGPDSQPGDWWLILPVGVDASKRDQVGDSDTPTPWSGSVSQDLIDADGNRMIELGSLVVRVGSKSLQQAGERPDLPDDAGSVTIEHVDGGSSIVMDQSGAITITGASITIDAGNGTVTIKAQSVDIQ